MGFAEVAGEVVAEMSKGGACFYCRHSVNKSNSATHATYFDCEFGIDNSEMNGGVEQVIACPQGDPRRGFQMGGYYTHMWFEVDGMPPETAGNPNPCLTWHIQGTGDFTTQDGEPHTEFHICDFTQIEDFVRFWGKELRKRGWITDDDEVD